MPSPSELAATFAANRARGRVAVTAAAGMACAAAEAGSLRVRFPRACAGLPEAVLVNTAGGIAIVLSEQYLEFARELGDRFAIMDRGEVVHAASRDGLDEQVTRRALAI